MASREQRWGEAHLEAGATVAYALAEQMFYEASSSGRTLVRYDRPGRGLSDPYDGPRTMGMGVELATIRAVTEAIGAREFDLFGWQPFGAAYGAYAAGAGGAAVHAKARESGVQPR